MLRDWKGNGSGVSKYNLTKHLCHIWPKRRREREQIFSKDLTYLLRGIPTTLLVGGDFNYVISNIEATGHQNYSLKLQDLMRGFDIVHVADIPRVHHLYTLQN